MSYTKLSVLSDTLKKANANGRTRFLSIADVMDMQDTYASATYQEIIEESINQSIGKQATKEVTGLLGAPLASLMSASVLFEQYLSDEENFELHAIEQIGVQFKNIAKRGEWENDRLIKKAISVASQYGMEDIVLNAVSIVRGKADVSAVLEEEVQEIKSCDLVLDDDGSTPQTPPSKGFNFSNL